MIIEANQTALTVFQQRLSTVGTQYRIPIARYLFCIGRRTSASRGGSLRDSARCSRIIICWPASRCILISVYESLFVMTLQRVVKASSSVTTQAAVSQQHITSVAVLMTVVMGLMNQPIAVSDLSII